MEERNSEGKRTFWAVVGIVVAGLIVVADKLLGSGILSDYPTAITLVGFALGVAKLFGDYSLSRPGKTMALVEKMKLDKFVGPTPPSSP